MHNPACPLCAPDDTQHLIWRNDQLRVIAVNGTEFPGYTRVIWHQHVAEMTDLDNAARQHIMEAVWAVETMMRQWLAPSKVNLAQFGNQVPHLHWHVIPRWQQDTHFPEAIWATAPVRSEQQQQQWSAMKAHKENLLPAYHEALRLALDALRF